MNSNKQLNFLDLISIASFCIGLMNLDENITQGDKQELLDKLSEQTKELLDEIHNHLQQQDAKLDMLLSHFKG